jgi:hypothetical protein
MVEIMLEDEVPGVFQKAVDSLRAVSERPELGLIQIPAPRNLASFSVAFAASTESHGILSDESLTTGRFVLLHEEKDQAEWNGNFRIVCFVKSPMEIDIADDQLVGDVTWGWLTSALKERNAKFHDAAGTATRVISSGYGMLGHQADHAELELRASWTPESEDLRAHLDAWQDLIALMAGHQQLPSNVSSLNVQEA